MKNVILVAVVALFGSANLQAQDTVSTTTVAPTSGLLASQTVGGSEYLVDAARDPGQGQTFSFANDFTIEAVTVEISGDTRGAQGTAEDAAALSLNIYEVPVDPVTGDPVLTLDATTLLGSYSDSTAETFDATAAATAPLFLTFDLDPTSTADLGMLSANTLYAFTITSSSTTDPSFRITRSVSDQFAAGNGIFTGGNNVPTLRAVDDVVFFLQGTLDSPPLPTVDPLGPIAGSEWNIDSQMEWLQAIGSGPYSISNGTAGPTTSNAVFESVVQQFVQKQRFENLTFKQTPDWVGGQWIGQGELGPESTTDAPVVLSIGPGDYWYFNRRSGSGREYNGFHSTDMQNWTHVGNVMGTDGTNPNGAPEYEWTTTAEFKAGVGGARDQILLYYDAPNDHDPHVMSIDIIAPGQLDFSSRTYHGQVLQDADGNDIQTPGSDMAMFRNLDGVFHMVHEDWSIIFARHHSWDSQLAGHSSSFDGINGFVYNEHPRIIEEPGNPVLDGDGNPTFATATHPNRDYIYQVHDRLDAWGDYEMIRVGDYYYLFCDDHPENGNIGLGYWYSDDIDGEFIYGGKIKDDFHPDPGVMFAEGEFHLFVQRSQDFSSTGPWVDGVEAQAGVDTDGDGVVDEWTEYQTVNESYFHIEGFAKAYGANDATLDLSSLPEGYGLQIRFRASNTLAVLDSIALNATAVEVCGQLGDVDQDGVVDFNDIPAFVSVLLGNLFQCEADCDENGMVDFNDIPAFVDLLLN